MSRNPSFSHRGSGHALPTPVSLRRGIQQLALAGLALSAIAQLLAVPARTVRRLVRRWQQPRHPLEPSYGNSGRLDEEDRIQREVYPVAEGQSRLQRNPGLIHSGRGYALGSWEFVCWRLEDALTQLPVLPGQLPTQPSARPNFMRGDSSAPTGMSRTHGNNAHPR